MNDIIEKYANDILEESQSGTSVSNIHQLLWEFLEKVVDTQTRYEYSTKFEEMVSHPHGEYIRYDSVHS